MVHLALARLLLPKLVQARQEYHFILVMLQNSAKYTSVLDPKESDSFSKALETTHPLSYTLIKSTQSETEDKAFSKETEPQAKRTQLSTNSCHKWMALNQVLQCS